MISHVSEKTERLRQNEKEPARESRRPADGTRTELNANSRHAWHVRRTRVYARGPGDRAIRRAREPRGVLVHDRRRQMRIFLTTCT